MAKICPLFSGSKGNSTYIGSSGEGVLIDVGRSTKQIENALRKNDIDISTIKAIFITHEHSDHIQGLKVFASRYNIKVFASQGTIQTLENKQILNNKISYEPIGKNDIIVGNMRVKSFLTSHDCSESCGYVVTTPDDRTATVATDLGFISEEIRNDMCNSDLVLIESNHDINMLQNGPYPYYLKRRILSNKGHLSNEDCSKELPDLVKNGVSRFILAHLSDENNIPELAYETANSVLNSYDMINGKDFELHIAPKENLGMKNVIY